jgi:hypothetical protein
MEPICRVLPLLMVAAACSSASIRGQGWEDAGIDAAREPDGGLGSACGDVFDSVYGGLCQQPPIPADELARIRPRYIASCESTYGLPGIGTTANDLEACAAAERGGICGAVPAPKACEPLTGTRAVGAPCNEAAQCAAGDCAFSDGGNCGVCVATTPLGQPCTRSGASHCAGDSICTAASEGGTVCVAVTLGDAGAGCGTEFAVCEPGLYCDDTTMSCAVPATVDEPCSQGTACMTPLICVGAPSGACQQPGEAGASCQSTADCEPGLGCSGGQCVVLVWAMPGQSCSALAPCLVGDLGACPVSSSTSQGTCPAIIADGQPCDPSDYAASCDTFATCFGGTCALTPAACP